MFRVDPGIIFEIQIEFQILCSLVTLIEDKLYEYACHEGNQAVGNILCGGRAKEIQ